LLGTYQSRISVNPRLDRSLVSFQANKGEPVYRWFKYKEGFSSALVRYLLNGLGLRPGVLLDPFAGAGAALFASHELAWSAVGIELLPVGTYVIEARLAAELVNPPAFTRQAGIIISKDLCKGFTQHHAFRHIAITEGAFPPETEKEIGGYLRYCEEVHNVHVQRLLRFACFAVLEEVSYTRKDGQYLRWDARSNRANGGKKFNKGQIPTFREAITRKLQEMRDDIDRRGGQRLGLLSPPPASTGYIDIRRGSCLDILPGLPDESVEVVLTSPPYCNRYDYTRTYALELAFLGYSDEDVKRLRQAMLSCTVENREKSAELMDIYSRHRALRRFSQIERVYHRQPALSEVLGCLDRQRQAGQLNNPNITRMVRNYFHEMSYVIAELGRVLRPAGKILMVNDNVRYGGQEVPVDLILSDFAAHFGLEVEHIWTLRRGKGNSSQQMGSHGRSELRKCVYVWRKPETIGRRRKEGTD